MLPESRERGYKPGRVSFNVKGGRCEACQGDGLRRIEMNFLPDVYVTCEVCCAAGSATTPRRWRCVTAANRFPDLLDLPVQDAIGVLENIPQIRQKAGNAGDRGPRLP